MVIKLEIQTQPMPGIEVRCSTEVVVDSEDEATQAGREFNKYAIALMHGFGDDADDDLDN